MYGIIVLTIYSILMLTVTLLFTKKANSENYFHVADRNINGFASALSVAATWIWAPSLFTASEKAYLNGTPGLFWFLFPNVLCLILFIPFAKKIRNELPNGITLSGYMQEKYSSKRLKNLYHFQLSSLAILSTSVQLLAGAKILSLVTNIPFFILTVLLAFIAFSYAQFSGIKASVITDVIQMITILAVSLLIIALLIKKSDDISVIFDGMGGISGNFKHLFDKSGFEVFLSFGLPTAIGLLSGPFGDQSFWQRAFSVKQNKIGKSFFAGALIFGIVPLLMGCIGYIAAGIKFIAIDSSLVNFELIKFILPKWSIAPFIFMLISGLLSTVDSNLCSVASLTTDIKKSDKRDNNIKISKVAMLTMLLLSVIIANIPKLTVTHLFLFYGTLRASTLLPTILTLKNVKLTEKGVLFGIICSLIIGLPIFAYGNAINNALLKSIGSLFTVCISGIVALIFKKVEVWHYE